MDSDRAPWNMAKFSDCQVQKAAFAQFSAVDKKGQKDQRKQL